MDLVRMIARLLKGILWIFALMISGVLLVIMLMLLYGVFCEIFMFLTGWFDMSKECCTGCCNQGRDCPLNKPYPLKDKVKDLMYSLPWKDIEWAIIMLLVAWLLFK